MEHNIFIALGLIIVVVSEILVMRSRKTVKSNITTFTVFGILSILMTYLFFLYGYPGMLMMIITSTVLQAIKWYALNKADYGLHKYIKTYMAIYMAIPIIVGLVKQFLL